MPSRSQISIFKQGSRTYFYSSLFFPKAVKDDVFTLYAFVRLADNFVDTIPQDRTGFYVFKESYFNARKGLASGNEIIDAFVSLAKRRQFEPAWVDAFLRAMELDLTKKIYATMEETEQYMYGSAEVVGLMMAAILGLPEAARPFARSLGRAMQYINFIRDLKEDQALGRRYLPTVELEKYKLDSLEEKEAHRKPERFTAFIAGQLAYYRKWQAEAQRGYRFIPRRYLVPVKTAAEMYGWTADRIDQTPFVIFRGVVKPAKSTILARIIANALSLPWRSQ
ncbi:MAG: phytoene/squalene synthase family protein [Candidatus Margulisiibacteriota bacterium]